MTSPTTTYISLVSWRGFNVWRVANSLGATSLEGLLGEINRVAPKRNKENDGSIGDLAHQHSVSDHNPCSCHRVVCARDFTHDPEGGFDSYEFAAWLALRLKLGLEPRVKYIISNGRICSGLNQPYRPGIWRPYKGSNPHDEHVHVSVQHPSRFFDNSDPWGWEKHNDLPETLPDTERTAWASIFAGDTPVDSREHGDS